MVLRPRAVFVALCALALAGCFVSEQPLISEADSVTPIAPGKYRLIEEGAAPEEEEFGLVSVDGAKTILSDAEAPSDGDAYLMRKVRGDYYVMMELPEDETDGYMYMLVRVGPSSFITLDFSMYCESLEALAESQGTSVASYGVAKVEDDNTDTCHFTRAG